MCQNPVGAADRDLTARRAPSFPEVPCLGLGLGSRPRPAVLQLRVVLAQISPLIWRRLLILDQTTIAEFHAVLQLAFGWTDEHLHRFVIHGVEYGQNRPGALRFSHDARTVPLAWFGLRQGERFT